VGENCFLTSEDKQCCCNCKHLAKDLSHPLTDGNPLSHVRGLVCLAPEFYDPSSMRKEVISGWGEHGLCETWEHWSQ
jgi:hypothetical protein